MVESERMQSFVRRHIPKVSAAEDAKFFSPVRARRGATIGAIYSTGVTTVVSLAVLLIDRKTPIAGELPHLLKFDAFQIASWSAIGSVIDGFKPTSDSIKRDIEDRTKAWRTTKEDFKELRSLMKEIPGQVKNRLSGKK